MRPRRPRRPMRPRGLASKRLLVSTERSSDNRSDEYFESLVITSDLIYECIGVAGRAL
jgi:hypothetical protein